MDFASSEIRRAWLSAAPPEAVYLWLKEKGEEAAARKTRLFEEPFPPELLEELAGRKERLIDLGLAQYGSNASILRRFWLSGDRALQHAVAANQVVGPHVVFFTKGPDILGRGDFDSQAQLEFARSDDVELQKTFFANSRVGFGLLSGVFERSGLYADIPEEKWLSFAAFAIRNPNLQNQYEFDPFAVDPWNEIQESKPFKAAYRMLLTVAPKASTAYVLADGVHKLGRLELPYDEFLEPAEPKPEVTSKEWQSWRKDRELALLKQLLERWTAEKSGDPQACDSDGKEQYSYQSMREAIASRVPTFDRAMREFIRDHPDPSVRAGYYQSENYTSAERLRTDFERDGRTFLEAAVGNEHLYRLSNKEISDEFDHILDRAKLGAEHRDWEDLQFLRARRHNTAAYRHRENPSIYLAPIRERPDASAWSSDDEESPELKEIRKLSEHIEVLSKSPDRDGIQKNMGEILNTVGRLSVKISERLDALAKDLGAIKEGQLALPTFLRANKRGQWSTVIWVAIAVGVFAVWLSSHR